MPYKMAINFSLFLVVGRVIDTIVAPIADISPSVANINSSITILPPFIYNYSLTDLKKVVKKNKQSCKQVITERYPGQYQ